MCLAAPSNARGKQRQRQWESFTIEHHREGNCDRDTVVHHQTGHLCEFSLDECWVGIGAREPMLCVPLPTTLIGIFHCSRFTT
jgi:hypothetical protein